MPDGNNQQQQQNDEQKQQQQNQQQQPAGFEAWLSKQDDAVKQLYETHTHGLKNALDTERSTRADLEKQVRNLAKSAEAGSQTQTQLTQLADKLSMVERQNQFYESAMAPEIGVKNPRLAWIAAQDAKLIGDDGKTDFKKLKEQFPELFAEPQKPPPAKGNGGNGAGNNAGAFSMDTFIRNQAGVKG